MKHQDAIGAMDHREMVYSDEDGPDKGHIVALGKYDTHDLADWERNNPCNRRGWAFISWASGVKTWTPLKNLRRN